jgi:hypothetical protein
MKQVNKLLLVSFILGALYAVYIVSYFLGIGGSSIGGAIATALVTPHIICVILAVIFNGLGCFQNKRGFALTGAILYTVALMLFIPYFMFVIIQMVLSFVGFTKLDKNTATM